jgi:hypothetical protein
LVDGLEFFPNRWAGGKEDIARIWGLPLDKRSTGKAAVKWRSGVNGSIRRDREAMLPTVVRRAVAQRVA